MATANRKTAASSAKKRTVTSKPKRSTAKFQDNFFRRNKTAIIIFILLFGSIGAYFLVTSHAESWDFIHAGNQTGPCISGNASASSTTIQQCDQTNDNRLFVDGTGSTATDNFHIRSKAGLCVDDWGGAKQTVAGSANRVYAHYRTCTDGDQNQQWFWAGTNNHEIKNVASGGCLNVAGSVAIGNPLIVYSCNGEYNELFFKSQPPSSPPTGGGGGTTTSGNCAGNTGAYGAIMGPGGSPNRIDQGMDFVPAVNGHPWSICAPAAGKITRADYNNSYVGTDGTALIMETLSNPPSSSEKYIYFAEKIVIRSNYLSASTSNPVAVQKGDILGSNSFGPGIEAGWGSSPTQGFACAFNGPNPTTCGYSFQSWVRAQ